MKIQCLSPSTVFRIYTLPHICHNNKQQRRRHGPKIHHAITSYLLKSYLTDSPNLPLQKHSNQKALARSNHSCLGL